MSTEINNRIKQVRERLLIQQKEMAARLGVNPSYYSDLENGRRTVTGKFIEKLMAIVPVEKDWIYTGKGIMFSTDDEYPNNLQSEKDVIEVINYMSENKSIGVLQDRYKNLVIPNFKKERSIAIEKLKELYDGEKLLIEAIHKIGIPEFMAEKFPLMGDFKEYLKQAEDDFNSEHKHLDKKLIEALKIKEFFEDEIDHRLMQLLKVIQYVNAYSGMIKSSVKRSK